MRVTNRRSYQVQCFFCDYWYLIFLVLAGVIFGIWLNANQSNVASPQAPGVETPPPIVGESPYYSTQTMIANPTEEENGSGSSTQVPILPSLPSDEKPEFIIAFIPIEWNDSVADFESVAIQHYTFFVYESGIEDYFEMDIRFVNQDDSLFAMSDNIVAELILYGTSQVPADRYVGLTTVDMGYEGDYGLAGWTMGDDCQGAISEYFDEEITAHELGHTFGLCDEYSMEAWELQNEHYINNCPNQLDDSCEMDEICFGVVAHDGSNSIMGVAGLIGEYSFNDQCKNALAARFASMMTGSNP